MGRVLICDDETGKKEVWLSAYGAFLHILKEEYNADLNWPNDRWAGTAKAICHGDAVHRWSVTDKALKARFVADADLKYSTRFDSDFAHAYARQAFLEVYKTLMRAKVKEGAHFKSRLELGGKGVGNGFARDGTRILNITTVRFEFEYHQGAWRELTGFPDATGNPPRTSLWKGGT